MPAATEDRLIDRQKVGGVIGLGEHQVILASGGKRAYLKVTF
jgi:hypothetical protein